MSPPGVVARLRGMFKHTALDQIVGVVATQAHPYRGAVNAPARHWLPLLRAAGDGERQHDHPTAALNDSRERAEPPLPACGSDVQVAALDAW